MQAFSCRQDFAACRDLVRTSTKVSGRYLPPVPHAARLAATGLAGRKDLLGRTCFHSQKKSSVNFRRGAFLISSDEPCRPHHRRLSITIVDFDISIAFVFDFNFTQGTEATMTTIVARGSIRRSCVDRDRVNRDRVNRGRVNRGDGRSRNIVGCGHGNHRSVVLC